MTTNQSKPDKFQAALNKFYDQYLLSDIGEIIDDNIRKDKLEEAEKIRKMIQVLKNGIEEKYIIDKKKDIDISKIFSKREVNYQSGGRRNYANNININAKDIKNLCKANQIKLSRVVNDKSVVYTKKELITKLKRKKLI